jgi:hypothetical protein
MPLLQKGIGFLFLRLTPHALRLTIEGKGRRIGWKNICKLWLQERTPEQLKVEGDN